MAQSPTPKTSGGLTCSQGAGERTLNGRVAGPILQGRYTVGRQFHSSVTGPGAMRLAPNPGTQTYGRKDFEMHGDSIRHPGEASEGCIIMPPAVRKLVDALPDSTLTITK